MSMKIFPDSLLFSSKQNGGGLKLTLILVQVSRCMEIMNVLFDLFVKCYLPAWFVLLRSRVHSRVCAAVWVLPQEPLFWKSLGKGGLWSAKQCQGHVLLTGVRTSSGAGNTTKPLCEELPVASHFWQCSLKCRMRWYSVCALGLVSARNYLLLHPQDNWIE